MDQEEAWEMAGAHPLSTEDLQSRPIGNTGDDDDDLIPYLQYIASNHGLRVAWVNHYTFKIPGIFADGGLFIAFSSVNIRTKGFEYRVYEGTAVRHIEYEDDDYSEEEEDNGPLRLVPCHYPAKALIREVDEPVPYLLDFVGAGGKFCGTPIGIGGTFLDFIEPYITYRYGAVKG